METSDVKRLKELEEENRKLKDMFASLSLKHSMLEDIYALLALVEHHQRWGCPNYSKGFVIKENLGIESVLSEFKTC